MGHEPIIYQCELCPVCEATRIAVENLAKKDDEISDMAGKIDSLENQLDCYLI